MNTKPTFSEANKNFQQGHYTRSLEQLNSLIDEHKDEKTYALLAKTLLKLGFKTDAARAFTLAANADEKHAIEYYRQAMLLHFETNNEDEALALGNKLLFAARKDADIAYIIASLFLRRGEKGILAPFRKVLSESNDLRHHMVASKLLTDDLDDDGNLKLARNLFNRQPRNSIARYVYLIFCREFCDFDAVEKHQKVLETLVARGEREFLKGDNPFYHLAWCGNEDANRYAALTAPEPLAPNHKNLRRRMPHNWGNKIRVGYVSADFWGGHATMKLMQRVLETHDKDRFDITLYCHTPEEHIEMEKGRRDEWGRIVTINHLNHADTAALIRKDEIDILVDLKGYTMGTRNRVFNHMAAPIQVSWLGFPGSTINVDIDYIIGDHHVLPDSSKPYFHERFCRLPDSYQPNDPVYRPRMEPVTRKDVGLPEDVFVYASFNATRKISLPTIELWSNILKRTKNSVIWIMSGHARTKANILKRFAANGIAASRVLFMPKIVYQYHVNRMQIADLGLDTFPINGHTTTSEQLWAGLPVLTVKGTNFASRVSESLLTAIGTPELIAETNQAYEDMAVALCENPEQIAAYKQTLVANRFVKPLFDADRFRHHLESAYVTMVERAKAGLDPDHFDVPALPVRTEPFMAE